MIRSLLAGIITLLAVTADATTFRIALSGANQIGGPGDQAGAGVAFVTVDAATVSYYLWAKGIATPIAAHIHSGRASESGSVVVDLAPTFASPAPDVYVASGAVAADPATLAAIAANPAAFYVNVHNEPFPGGAVRGQLLGSGAAANAFASTLRGSRDVPVPGDPDGSGFAGVILDGSDLYYYLRAQDVATPTAAHIHRGGTGEAGPVVVTFIPAFTDGVAFGNAVVATATLPEILGHPERFYVNVHNDDFPGGALRGQLGPTETVRHFPVVAHNKGAGTSAFKSDVRILNLTDEDATVYVEWYPKTATGSAGPAKTVPVVVTASGEAVVDDAVDTLFSANDRGAMRLVSLSPFHAVENTYNDQRGSGSGTFGQFAEALDIDHAFTAGALLLNSNRPKADLVDFRTNLGYFNPNPFPVTLTLNVRKPDGTLVGAPTQKVLPPYSNDLLLYYQIATGVPGNQRNQANFFMSYTTDGPAFVFSSVVDNKTDDGLQQPALPFPPSSIQTPNSPPDAQIAEPAADTSARVGQVLIFSASTSDPEDDAVTVAWSFGDGATASGLSTTHAFASEGAFTVTLTATDARGLADPTPAQRTITVGPNAPPDGTIVTPAGDLAIRAGQSVSFAAAASDPDGDPVTVLWDFGDSSTSTALVPSDHVYTTPGAYTVTLTASDSLGLADPTPATRTVAVGPNAPPDGTIVAPAADIAIREGQSVSFEGAVSDPDGDPVTVLWDFGDTFTSTALVPGGHIFATPGTYTVTLTATDDLGLADPTPATRTITVAGNNPPDGTIVTPEGDVTVLVNGAVAFQGTIADPDGDAVTGLWDFGDGVSSSDLATTHTYLTAGIYAVTFTATDAFGLADPTPATRTITVNDAPTVTLTQLQQEIFTNACSGCHPPNQGMDLRPGHTFASTVNVSSSEQPALKRIAPGDPDNSYLIRKLVGGPNISQSRMPQGGPFLTPDQIQRIRDWILAGAHND